MKILIKILPVLCLIGIAGNLNAADPFSKKKQAPKVEKSGPLQIGILLEYIRLPHAKANELLRKYAKQAVDAQSLRDELETLIKEEKASLVETNWLVCRSGQRSRSQSVVEHIYPTEYDPPQLGQPGEGEEIAKEVIASATPVAFEARNVGAIMEVDPVLGADGVTIDINLAPELVRYIGEQHYTELGQETAGVENVSMPRFYTMKVTTAVTARDGKYILLEIFTPHDGDEDRILLLLKADVLRFP